MRVASEDCSLSACSVGTDGKAIAAASAALLEHARYEPGIEGPIMRPRSQPGPEFGPVASTSTLQKHRSYEPIDIAADEPAYGDDVAQAKWFSTKSEDIELERQFRRAADINIDAVYEGLHPPTRLARKRGFYERRGPRKVNGAHRLIKRNGQRPEHLGDTPKRDMAQHFHLGEPKVGMNEPERESGVPVVFGHDKRDLVLIKMNDYGRTQGQA